MFDEVMFTKPRAKPAPRALARQPGVQEIKRTVGVTTQWNLKPGVLQHEREK